MPADDLYARPLEEFTRARDDEAKRLRKEGDRAGADEVKALRKPSKAAWAINQVVRRQRDDVDRLLAAGDDVREALAAGRDPRAPSQALGRVVDELADAAAALGGAVARDDAVTTFRAAAADPALAGELRSAQLVTPLAATGFDAAGLGIMAPDRAPDEGPDRAAGDREARRRAQHQDLVDRLRAEADRARERAELLAGEAAAAADRAVEARRKYEKARDAAT